MGINLKCPRCGGVVTTGVSNPSCLTCKTRWLSGTDLRAEMEKAKRDGREYIANGTFQEDLSKLVRATEDRILDMLIESFEQAEKTARDRRDAEIIDTMVWCRADEQLKTVEIFLGWVKQKKMLLKMERTNANPDA